MVNIVKKKLRKAVLSKLNKQIAAYGEDKALTASAVSLRALGSISRSSLLDIMAINWRWNKLRNKPDEPTLNKLNDLLNQLDDVDKAKIVFSEIGEGAAWVYIDEIELILKDTDNRYTREIMSLITKARLKNDKLPNMQQRG